MKRLLTALFLTALVLSIAACSGQPSDSSSEATVSKPTSEPEPEPYAPMDIFGSEFNPLAETEMPGNLTVLMASFIKGSPKLEGRNPYTLSFSASGNMFAAVAYQADIAGLSEEEKSNRFNEYSEIGFCEFTGTDGRVVTIKQTKPHDKNHENGACTIDIAFDVPAADVEKYTDLIRDNYNMNALSSVREGMDIETDFAECSIEVSLQNKESIVAVQYYVDDAEAVKQVASDAPQSESGEWNGHPSVVIPYGIIKNTLVFDSRYGAAVLILQTSNELNSPLGKYVEPEFSLAKFGFGFDDVGTCGVYEEREPHYKSVAIHRPEWGEFPDGWNIELSDWDVNGYVLLMWYFANEEKYHIALNNQDGDGLASYDYFPKTGKHGGHPDEVKQIFNEFYGTQGDEFYGKPLAYFEQLVQERFNMSIQEMYALPKQ